MTPETIARYDQSRKLDGQGVRAMCYAPHTNVFFDMRGFAKACCWNGAYPLGHVKNKTFDEMWSGPEAKALRRAVEAYDFALGCGFCERQTADGWTERTVMKNFDRFKVPAPDPEWPQRFEFSISNTCNLECVMCTGLYSSAIRARREKLPPSPKVYSLEFLKSLRKYLPHLQMAKFLGGEPFLIKEYYTIWTMMVEDAPHVLCHITTNGTQYNRRVERFMDKLRFGFAVSLDGASKKTVESIRVNANFEEQMAILKRLREYTNEKKTDLSLTFCFMPQNCREFGDFCLMADEWGCNVGVNTVTRPLEYSLTSLSPVELRAVVAEMERQAVHLDGALKRNRAVWFAEFDRLRRKCGAEPALTAS